MWKKDFTVEIEVKDFSGEVSVEKIFPPIKGAAKKKKKRKSAIALAMNSIPLIVHYHWPNNFQRNMRVES